MKIKLYCQCRENVDVLLNDTNKNILSFTCGQGHSNTVYLSNKKYDLLFEIGVSALLDNYYREAVTDFSAALESFREYYYCISLFSRGISFDKIQEIKKLIYLSERQLGAYYAISSLDKMELPQGDEKRSKFRNNIVHKGYWPTYEEALDYGSWVLDCVRRDSHIIRDKYLESRHRYDFENEKEKLSIVGGSEVELGTILEMDWLVLQRRNPTLIDFINQRKTDRFINPRHRAI